jgi:hypothetical protein
MAGSYGTVTTILAALILTGLHRRRVDISARLEDAAGGGQLPGLAEFLAKVPDRRRAQGCRHPLVTILLLACAAVAAGSRSLVAIAEWAARAPEWVLEASGARRDQRTGCPVVAVGDHDPPHSRRCRRGRGR